MFELCRAVNEREAAIGLAKTTWRTNTGLFTADITMDQLELLNFRAGASTNLTKIQAAVVALIATGLFTETSGGTDVWTLATVEAEIGTDLSSVQIKPTEARFWQAQQDALDLLIYVMADGVIVPFTTDCRNKGGSSESTAQLAWDARGSTGDIASSYVGAAWHASSGTGLFGPWWNVRTYGPATIDYTFPDIDGTVVASAYRVTELSQGYIDSPYVIGSLSHTIPPATASQTLWRASSLIDFAAGSTATITIALTPEPAIMPFNSYPPPPAFSNITVLLEGVAIFVDLSSVLEDQA